MLRPIFTILLLLAVNSQMAQDLIVYYESQPGQSQTDTLYVYFQSLTGQAIDISSVTMSFCYTSSAQLQPTHVSSEFSTQWGGNYEVCTSDAELTSYDGTQFAHRAKYAITTLNPAGITIPAVTNGLGQLMLKLPFSVSGSAYGQYYVESTAQNSVNEIGDNQGNLIDYLTWNATYPFPVEWLSFQAMPTEEGFVQLDWQTASELNNDYFEIEKSFDGDVFQSLDRIKGQRQTSSVQTYGYLDKGYLRSEVYYRIKQVDINGAFSYSDVVKVNLTVFQTSKLQISPVPFDDFLIVRTLDPQAKDALVTLYDVTGRLILSESWAAGNVEINIPTGQLKSGMYILKVVDSFGKVESTPIVKK